jgi:hypothetical protein
MVGLVSAIGVLVLKFGKELMVSCCDWLVCGWTTLGSVRDGSKLIVQMKEEKGSFRAGEGFLL